MKRIFALCGLLVAAAGCSKIKDAATFSFSMPFESTIAVASLPGQPAADTLIPLPQPLPADLPSFPIATRNEVTFSQNNTATDKIVSAKLKQLSMTVTQPPNGTFNFLNEVKVYMSADGVAEMLVAQKVPVPKGANSIDLDVQNVELKPLLLKDTIRVRVAAVFNALPASSTQLHLKSVFGLTANPLN